MLCQCWSYFFHWFNIDKMLNVLVLYQCHFRTCCYNVTLTSYQWLYQHWTLNILLRCCKSTHTKRGQVCDVMGILTFNSICPNTTLAIFHTNLYFFQKCWNFQFFFFFPPSNKKILKENIEHSRKFYLVEMIF